MQKTRASLHRALLGLAREKPYPAIEVKEILDRANVGKSTFYMHFRDKDDLFETGIHEILQSFQGPPCAGRPFERLLAFSLPFLTHINEHRRAAGPRMKREGRVIMHEHLEEVLRSRIADEVETLRRDRPDTGVPTDLVARYVASTFVLVLNWWVERATPLSPADADARFRSLVMPTLTGLLKPL